MKLNKTMVYTCRSNKINEGWQRGEAITKRLYAFACITTVRIQVSLKKQQKIHFVSPLHVVASCISLAAAFEAACAHRDGLLYLPIFVNLRLTVLEIHFVSPLHKKRRLLSAFFYYEQILHLRIQHIDNYQIF